MATVRELITKIVFHVDDNGIKKAEKSTSDYTKKAKQAGEQGQKSMDKAASATNKAGSAGTKATTAMGRFRAALSAINSKANELVCAVEALAEKAEQLSVCRDLTREVANEFIESVVIFDPKHIEIKFTFDDLLQKAADRVTEIQKERVSA